MARPATAPEPEQLRDRILDFIGRCSHRRPVLKEDGGEVMPLEPDHFSLEVQRGKVLLEAWHDSGTMVRRVAEIRRETPSEMVLECLRFGGGHSMLRLMATSKGEQQLRGDIGRGQFTVRLRKLLLQACPGWRLQHISSERDQTRARSSNVARAVISQGQSIWAVAACDEEHAHDAVHSALTQGLLWLDEWRGRYFGQSAKKVVRGLKLLLPAGTEQVPCLRLQHLNRELSLFEIFVFDGKDGVEEAPEAEPANLATELPAASMPAAPETAVELRLRAMADGAPAGTACRIHGFEFARTRDDGAGFGFDDQWHPLTLDSLPRALALAREIARFRSPESPDVRHRFYTAQPERWLESLLVRDISRLDSRLDPRFAYSQVPAVAGIERGIVDLLAITREGRLVVIEIKAKEDPDLPLQALDYWMRVKWHLERGAFARLGYFPGVEIRPDPPLLWLVAPIYEFHSATDVVLRYLSPSIPVRRIGLNHNWREGVRVIDRG